jgi:nicotinate-nucleotide--dimethylbenzimidazole phosphoribosyltransferase
MSNGKFMVVNAIMDFFLLKEENMLEQIKNITGINQQMVEKAQQRVNSLIKPKGSLGDLEKIYVQLAGIQNTLKPSVANRGIIVMSGDHGIVEEGVATSTKEITLFQTENMTKGLTGVCALARQAKADLTVVDIGINNEVQSEQVIDKKIKYGTNNFAKTKAMTYAEAKKSVAVGIEIAEQVINEGKQLIGTGEMGIGNTTPSSAIVSVITGVDPIEVTGRGANLPSEKLQHKADVIKKAIALHQPNKNDGYDILSKVGGLEIGGMAGVMLGCAIHNTPVVVDGFISTAAALIAYTIEPKVKDYLIPSHTSEEKGAELAADILELKPPLKLGLRLGEGTGAAIMFNVIEAATFMNEDMITFDEAGWRVL